MRNLKFIAGILVLGSVWGLLECTLGDYLHNSSLPAGIFMTGFFAVGLMTLGRMFYKQRGMQLGMGLVAGFLRLVNPFTGYFICSAIAIMAEGVLFEFIWLSLSSDLEEIKGMTMKISMGIITGYSCYIGGYMITQILTPAFSAAGFHLSNLILFIPRILADGAWAALLGSIITPVALSMKYVNPLKVRDRIYYPTTAMITALCWIIVIADTFLIVA